MSDLEKWCLYQHDLENFTCGSCRQAFSAICQLHHHLREHNDGGSYHYDHKSQTAFLKYDAVCAYVQTDPFTKEKENKEHIEDETSYIQSNLKSENLLLESGTDIVLFIQNEANDDIKSDQNYSNGDCELNWNTRNTYSKTGSEQEKMMLDRIVKEDADKQNIDTDSMYNNDVETVSKDISVGTVANSNSDETPISDMKQRESLKKKMFKCTNNNCGAKFSSKKTLRLHLAEHSGKVLLSCDFCQKQFVHKPALCVHMRLHERDQMKVETNETESHLFQLSSTRSQMDIVNETKTHSVTKNHSKKPGHDPVENTIYECRTCEAVLSSKSELKSHEKTHKRKQFVCSKCPKIFATKQGLTFHSNIHDGKKFECDICGKTYGHANTLKKHKVQHSQDTQYKCKICGRYFAILSLYKKHMTSHTREKGFTCEVCGFQTHCSNILKAHVSTHGENQFKCEECSKTFSRKGALVEHMHTHSGVKPFVCEYCAMSFAYQSSLVTHLRIHTGHRPYKCETCSRTFSLRHIYRRHLLTHTQERPYKCTVCDKGFTQEYNRSVHMRQHTGEKPFVCEICARRFTQRCTLRNHLKSHYDKQ